MENYRLDSDINLFCVKADSYPAGIMAAHEKLTTLVKPQDNHSYFGVSYLYDDKILYMAGAEMDKRKDDIPAGCERYILRRGNYISIYIADFAKNIAQIGEAFEKLLADPGIDPEGCCAECYLPEGTNGLTAKDVRCMVRLAD